MNTISRVFSGIAFVLFGIFLIYSSTDESSGDSIVSILFGVFFVVLGAYIFFNRKEDDIEEITDSKEK